MVLYEDNYIEKITSLTAADWQPLFELIPVIQSTSEFGVMTSEEKNNNGVLQIPYLLEAPVVAKFVEIVYDLPVMMKFDWSVWAEGREIVRNKNFDFDRLDIPTKCKLITAIVRNDRFCEGALVSAFESGLILKIIKSIKNQVDIDNVRQV